jgi:hypothetical protein
MLLSVFGSDNVFHPLSEEPCKYAGSPRNNAIPISVSSDLTDDAEGEESVLDEVRELILSAKLHGAWTAGVGGLKMVRLVSVKLSRIVCWSHSNCPCLVQSHHNESLPRELKGLPMSDKLKAQIGEY